MNVPLIVKISRDRGYGDSLWKVLSSDNVHYNLENLESGKKITLYKVHTYPDMECIRARIALKKDKVEEAKKIGKKK